jgi:hypothetical protein
MMNPTLRARIAGCALVLLAGALAPRTASAQSEDEAAARVLFNEGRQLVKAGKYEEACGKLEAARKLYASPGVLLNVADCHERINRTASAWTEFGDAADAAARAGRSSDEAEAKRRQAAIQGRLTLLAIVVDHAPDGATVRRDGTPIDRSAWGTPVPVDPGEHNITMEASGYRPWSAKVTATQPGKTETVRIPTLEPVPSAPASAGTTASAAPPAESTGAGAGGSTASPPPSDTRRSSPGAGQRAAGWAVGGVGVAAMAASGVLAIVARSKYSSAQDEKVNRHDDSVAAGHIADIATAVLIGGGVATAVGAVLLITAPKAQVTVGTTGTALVLSGRF